MLHVARWWSRRHSTVVSFCAATIFLYSSLDSAIAQTETRFMEKSISYQGGFTGSQAVDLGDLAGGTIINLFLSVANNSSEAIEVRDVRGSCSCTKVEFNKGRIEQGEVIPLRIHLTVPTQANREARAVPIYVDIDDQTQLELAIRFKIDNLACFQNETELYQVRREESMKSMQKIKIPLIISKSVDLRNLRLRSTGDYANGVFEFETIDSKVYAVSKFTIDEFPIGGFSGQVFLDNLATKSSDDIRLLIQMHSDLECSPEILQLTPLSTSAWKSMAILRVASSEDTDTESNSKTLSSNPDAQKLKVLANMENCTVEVQCVSLSSELYRVKFEITPNREIVDRNSLPTTLNMSIGTQCFEAVIGR